MKRLLFVWCISQLIACSAMEDQQYRDIDFNHYAREVILQDLHFGASRELLAGEHTLTPERRAVLETMVGTEDCILRMDTLSTHQHDKISKFATLAPYLRYATGITVLIASGTGAVKLIKDYRRPVKRDIYSALTEKVVSLTLLGGAFAAYKLKGWWDNRQMGQLKSETKELRKVTDQLETRYAQLVECQETEGAKLGELAHQVEINNQALQAVFENLRGVQGQLEAVQGPVQDLKDNQRAIVEKIGAIMKKSEDMLIAIRAKKK